MARVSHKEKIANPAPSEPWTRADDYIGAMARKRSFRRAREPRQRTQPERPRMLLSTVPFLALLILLAVLGVSIMIIAFPGSQPQIKQPTPAAKEKGYAPKGWFQEAEKEMHR